VNLTFVFIVEKESKSKCWKN